MPRSQSRLLVALTLLLAAASAGPVSAEEADWYPSKYGADDSLGAFNELRPERTLAAARLVKTGQTYALGMVTAADTPAFAHRSYQINLWAAGPPDGGTIGGNAGVYNDDQVITFLGIGTQIDGLGHVGIGHRYYNGTPVAEFLKPDGVTRFGIEDLPPVATRGVLLDLPALRGQERLPAGTAINREEIEAAARRQGLTIGAGDVVLLHTGHAALATSDPGAFMSSEPGLGIEGARHLASLGVAAVGADTFAVEVLPPEQEGSFFPVHQELLTKRGVYILENIRTEELARDGVDEFLFVLGAARMKGAVQMIINPVAIR